ncbi:glycerophosphodiester phosphodiesterase family protein [Bacillus salipaludis]|uniref:Glycerophosphodiester phosphodiesterase family protein n=1 Tax=Bacillus salipaludis TaxID=2547811 RepID=A0ABW8RLG4_9BACI
MIGKKEFNSINNLLNQKLKEKGILIAVHRGSPGGNIIENTIPAYKAALKQKGDILEIDVIKSTDGVLYVFHDGQEKRLLNENDNIKTLASTKIEGLTYLNAIGHKTSYKVERLDDILEAYKGEVLINIDRAWDIWLELLPKLDQHDMVNQIILKGPVVREQLEFLNSYKTKYMFMPIIHSLHEIDVTLEYQNINLVGIELIADSEQHPLFQDEVISSIKNNDLFVWANAINLDDEIILFAKLDDNTSIIQNPDLGWGRLFDKKVDIIQTDWPAILADYRDHKIQ